MPQIPRISVPAAPNLKAQVASSLGAMSPQTRELFTPKVLSRSLLNAPIAEGLDNMLRIRVVGNGTPSERQFVADNALTKQFMGTKAWGNLERQLRVAATGADWAPGKTTLKGFMFPKDLQAVAAGEVLGQVEGHGVEAEKFTRQLHRSDQSGGALRSLGAQVKDGAKFAGAWNDGGWITFMPDTARAMLVEAGAYHPNGHTEKPFYRAGSWSNYISGNAAHEVQHSVTTPGSAYTDRIAWMEEGTANLFSRTWPVLGQHQKAAGTTEQSYASRLGHDPLVKIDGWGKWDRPKASKAEQKKLDERAKTRYADSLPILKGMLRMAGIPNFQTVEGREQGRQLLQGRSLRYVPGDIADAIIKHNKLDPSVREPLRERLMDAIKDPHSLEKIQQDFGIPKPT